MLDGAFFLNPVRLFVNLKLCLRKAMSFAHLYTITYRCQQTEKKVSAQGELSGIDSRTLERKLTMREGGARCQILTIEDNGEVLGLKLNSNQLLFD